MKKKREQHGLSPCVTKLLCFFNFTLLLLIISVSGVIASGKMDGSLMQQQTTISGTVTDISGQRLPGVTVVLKGTTTGTVTDVDGHYTLSNVPENSTLQFSFVGMKMQEVVLTAGQTTVDVVMEAETIGIEEVVAVGYGTQIKSTVTGSISSVGGEDLENTLTTTVAEALQGRISGAFVLPTGGEPGASANIYLRGPISISGGSPLYVVDGVPMDDLGYGFNMEDVQSINVLKDASAAAIYGAKAAAGVILITTKRGAQAAKTEITFNGTYGVRNVLNLPKLLRRDEYIRAKQLAGFDVVDLFGPESGWSSLPDTDWFGLMYNQGVEQNYTISVSGSGGSSNYYLSGNYNNIEGTLVNNWVKRYTFRVNSDHQLTKRVKFSESIYMKAGVENPPVRPGNGYLSYRTTPIMPLYEADGGWGQTPKGIQAGNRMATMMTLYQRYKSYSANVSGTLDFMIMEGLHLKAFLGTTLEYVDSYSYQEPYTIGINTTTEDYSKENAKNQTYIGTYTLNYNKVFGEHSIVALLGYEARKRDFGNLNYSNRDAFLPRPQTSDLAISNSALSASFLQNDVLDRILSQFARLEYSYNGKYLFTANVRRDGYGSKFGPKNKYGIFPGASVGWVVSKEDFMSQYSFITLLKLRAGYGLLGNAVGSDFAYTSFFQAGSNYDWSVEPGVQRSTGITIAPKLPNPDIQWEEVATTNIGADVSFWNNRLTMNLDYYSRQTKKMLYDVALSPSAGVGPSVPANIGQMSNKGIEFQIMYRNQVGDFSYDVTVNAGHNQNELISLNPDLERLYVPSGDIGEGESGNGFYGLAQPCRSEPGQPLGQFYGLETAGIYATDAAEGTRPTYSGYTPQAGDLIYVDRNGDGIINVDDYTYIGNPWPDLTYGITLGANWKGIDLKFQFNGTLGNDIYNADESWYYNFLTDYNTKADIFKTSFFGDNGLTNIPRADQLATPDRNKNWGAVSDYHVRPGSYLRLSNVQVGYELPASLANKIKLSRAKIFLTANNIFTLTKYNGMDPVIPAEAEYGGILAQGLDHTSARYPLSRIVSLGVNLTF